MLGFRYCNVYLLTDVDKRPWWILDNVDEASCRWKETVLVARGFSVDGLQCLKQFVPRVRGVSGLPLQGSASVQGPDSRNKILNCRFLLTFYSQKLFLRMLYFLLKVFLKIKFKEVFIFSKRMFLNVVVNYVLKLG